MARDVAHEEIDRLEYRRIAIVACRLCLVAEQATIENVQSLDSYMSLPEKTGTIRDTSSLLSGQS
jgi:hypothetical protein